MCEGGVWGGDWEFFLSCCLVFLCCRNLNVPDISWRATGRQLFFFFFLPFFVEKGVSLSAACLGFCFNVLLVNLFHLWLISFLDMGCACGQVQHQQRQVVRSDGGWFSGWSAMATVCSLCCHVWGWCTTGHLGVDARRLEPCAACYHSDIIYPGLFFKLVFGVFRFEV